MRMLALGAVLALMVACGPSETDERIADMRASTERLQATIAETDAIIEAAKPSAAWAVQAGRSLLTDEPSVRIATQSQLFDGAFGHERAQLIIACDEGEVSVVVAWPRSLKGRGRIDAQMRLDDAPARTVEPLIATNDTGFGWWGWREAGPVIADLTNAQRAVVRGTAYDGSAMDAEFNITGLSTHLEEVEAACPR